MTGSYLKDDGNAPFYVLRNTPGFPISGTPTEPANKFDQSAATLKIEHDFDFFKFTSLTGFQQNRSDINSNAADKLVYDAIRFPFISTPGQTIDHERASARRHGRYLNLLYRIQREWLERWLPMLLPLGNASQRQSAWVAHLQDDVGPIDGLITKTAYHECYLSEIRKMQDDAPGEGARQDQRLAAYLITLHIRGSLPPELLDQFLERAPVSARQEAMRVVGLTIGSKSGSTPAKFRDRARSYWVMRLLAAKGSAYRSHYASEIGSIGH